VHSSDPAPVQVDVGALYLKYREVMERVARSVLDGRADLANDAVSAVVQELCRAHKAGTLTPKDNWEAYIVSSVRNAARRLARDEARTTTIDTDRSGTASASDDVHPDPDGERQIDRVNDVAVLRAGWAKLTERKQTIIWRRFVHQDTPTEIAEALGITTQAVGQNERQALHQLREEWTDDERPT
jgi:RNA polymerase sigma factor (sigma-70 family)